MAGGGRSGYDALVIAVLIGVVAYYLRTREQALESRLTALERVNSDLRDLVAAGSSGQTSRLQDAAPLAPDAGKLSYGATALDFAMVSDLDKESRDPRRLSWHAFVRRGSLLFEPAATPGTASRWRIEWRGTDRIESTIAAKNRSLELSELIRFNGQLLAVCDSTGIVFEVDIAKRKVYQRLALTDGDGYSAKPFKTEWATVKDGVLLVGSMGREWVREDGSIEHFNPQWVKAIDRSGKVRSVNWRPFYQAMRSLTNTTLPGYLWHEAVEWDPRSRRWLILPRKASESEPYTPESDETRGTNFLFLASEDFSSIEVRHLGPLQLEWGFSALRKVPGHDSTYLALKVYEVNGRTETRIALFDLLGPGGEPRMLLDPPFQPVGDSKESEAKYEGLEFLSDG